MVTYYRGKRFVLRPPLPENLRASIDAVPTPYNPLLAPSNAPSEALKAPSEDPV